MEGNEAYQIRSLGHTQFHGSQLDCKAWLLECILTCGDYSVLSVYLEKPFTIPSANWF